MAGRHATAWWLLPPAWIKPARLVHAWLQHPRVQFHGQASVHGLERVQGQWLLRDPQSRELGRADKLVFANAHGCVDLLMRLASSLAAQTDAHPWLADGKDTASRSELTGTLAWVQFFP